MDVFKFLKGFGLARTAATVTSFIAIHARWDINHASQPRLQDLPVEFGIAVMLWIIGAVVYFLPVLGAYWLVRRLQLANVAFYLLGATVLATVTATIFIHEPTSYEIPLSPWAQYFQHLLVLLPACLAGAVTFWWAVERRHPLTDASEH